MRGGKFISVNNFSAQEHPSPKTGHILNFRSMAVLDIKLWTCLSASVHLGKVHLIWQRGIKILREGKIFRHPKGGLWKNRWARRWGSENLYTSKPTRGGLLKNWTASEGGCQKLRVSISSSYPPLVIWNELPLISEFLAFLEVKVLGFFLDQFR